jgi:hypothetical protein
VVVAPCIIVLKPQKAINRTDKYSNIIQISSCHQHFFLFYYTKPQPQALVSFFSGFKTCDILRREVVSRYPTHNMEDQFSVFMARRQGDTTISLDIG